MKKTFLLAPLALSLAACAAPEPLTSYRPVVDIVSPTYEADLAYCQGLAQSAKADYDRRQGDAMAANIIGGLIVGAIVGNAVGGNSDWTAYGAASGAVQGAAATDVELAQGGPRRIVDRCLAGRGHRVLSDLGRG